MAGGRITVVVADDSPSFRSVLVELVDSIPRLACVGEARSGAEAVELTAVHHPDLVLMDVRMADVDGFAAAAVIASLAPATTVVLISAGPTEQSQAEARKVGAYALLDKHALHSATLKALVKAVARPKRTGSTLPAE